MSDLPKTQFLTNDPLTRKKWAKDLFRVMLPEVEFNYLIGTGTDSPVQMRTELGKGEGDTITFGIRKPLTGEGVVGNAEIEGNEEELRFANFNVTIDELNHAVDTGGKMEEQRIPYDLMSEGKAALQDWWADKLSELLINTLTSNTNYKIRSAYFANTIEAADTNHALNVNDVAEASMTSADIIDLGFLDRAKQRAEVMNKLGANHYKIRPIKLKGKNYYRVVLDTYGFDSLRQNTNVGQWGDLLRSAQKLAMPEVEIEYNGLLVSKSERVPLVQPYSGSATTGVYRGVLLGAQAACWAWGGAGDSKSTVMSFHPYTKDADRFMMVRGGGIFGVKNTRFEGFDYGKITLSYWANPLS